jgi:hypothetical protein
MIRCKGVITKNTQGVFPLLKLQTNNFKKNAKYDTKTGIITWKLDIYSNQKLKKQFSYQIKYPKSKQITL